MKIVVDRKDLEDALGIVSNTVGNTSGHIESHFVFKANEDKQVEIFSTNGRIFSSSPLKTVTSEIGEYSAFTIEAKRLFGKSGWLSAVSDSSLTFTFDGEKVTGLTSKGSIRFPSLDPTSFPYWDNLKKSLKKTADIDPKTLSNILRYNTQFVSDDEARNPKMCVVECINGFFFSGRKECLVRSFAKGMEESNIRIHSKDVRSVINFLSKFKSNVSLLESDRVMILESSDGSVFGEMKFNAKFPELQGFDIDNKYYWTLSSKEILDSIKFLIPAMEHSDIRVLFRPAKNNGVEIGVSAIAGGLSTLSLTVNGQSESCYDGEGFFVSYPHLVKVLEHLEQDEVVFGINPSPKGNGGFVKISHSVDDINFLSTLSWLIS